MESGFLLLLMISSLLFQQITQPINLTKKSMKIYCKCGATISDSSDFAYHKGYVIPDQDLEDLQCEIVKFPKLNLGTIWKYSKTIFQCHECSCLILELNNEYRFFSAADPEKSQYAVRSLFSEH